MLARVYMVVVEEPTKPQNCRNLWWSLARNCQHGPKLMQMVTMFHWSWIGLLITMINSTWIHQCDTCKTKHWQLHFMVVGEDHSLWNPTRTLLTVCWCVLWGRGGGVASSCFVLGGCGGGASLSICCGSLLSGSLGDWRVSPAENCCGGIGGGGGGVSSYSSHRTSFTVVKQLKFRPICPA